MDYSLSKPIFQFQAQQKYRRHLSKLQSIVNSRKNCFTMPADALESHQRLRHQSIDYHQRQSSLSINRENEKMLGRLISISNRKKSTNLYLEAAPRIVHYHNPARKIRERLITELNHRFAERLIKRESIFNTKIIRREIDEYQKLKRTLTNNKKALRTSLSFTETAKSLSRNIQHTTHLRQQFSDFGSRNKSLILK